MFKFRINTLTLVLLLLLVFLAGTILFLKSGAQSSCPGDFMWLNSELGCEKPAVSKAEYKIFRTALEEKLDAFTRAGAIEEAAVYFRDLENGPTFGIQEKEEFIPASLLKVPVMLTYFKLAEEDPTLLSTTLSYSSTSKMKLYPQTIEPAQVIAFDTPYTVDELIYRMIAYSDNRAYGLLFDYLKNLWPATSLLAETYAELGMTNPGDDLTLASLSVKQYTSLFRLLYNASYLSEEFSEKALDHLAHASFTRGLRAGVPADIAVAHKFGEHRLGSGETAQLHDCGIVYFPGNPYALCVMTRGDDPNELSLVIAAISQAVYEEVESRRK